MSFSSPIQLCHSHVDPIWPDGTFKVVNKCIYFQPENIVCSGRNGESIKIIDFGTAMQLTSGQQEQLFFIFFSRSFRYMIKLLIL